MTPRSRPWNSGPDRPSRDLCGWGLGGGCRKGSVRLTYDYGVIVMASSTGREEWQEDEAPRWPAPHFLVQGSWRSLLRMFSRAEWAPPTTSRPERGASPMPGDRHASAPPRAGRVLRTGLRTATGPASGPERPSQLK